MSGFASKVSISGLNLTATTPTVTATNIDVSTVGDNDILTPTAGKALCITKLAVKSANDSEFDILVKADNTTIGTYISIVGFFDDQPYPLKLGVDEVLKLNLSSATRVTGYVTFYEV